MSASGIILLLAVLPVVQSSNSLAADEPIAPKSHRRLLAPEYGAPQPSGTEPPPQITQPSDARLTSVCFVDPQNGWTVGDYGAILHTDDGGQHWAAQTSGVTCTLNSVCFVDSRNGWVAGGQAYPYLHDSCGVVLCTHDGGLNWQREPTLLPALRKIRFLSQRQGWAIGCSSTMFPGGAFLTRDGGRSWQPAYSGGASRLLSGDFFDARNAVLGGSLGLLATINEGDFSRVNRSSFVLPSIHEMQAISPAYGWLVGDGGWIALTGNRGNSWSAPLGAISPQAAMFDFAALAVRGPKCWIAGSPGSRVFFTPDAGRTWSAFPTGTNLPLKAITFVDETHGWAVGQLGLILASNDGGRTWRRQRSGGARAAVMAIAGMPQDLPLELLAWTCKDQGNLGVAEVLGRTDAEGAPRGDVPFADQLHQAMTHIGVCSGETAWGFPVRQPSLLLPESAIVEAWTHVHNGHGSDALLAHIVEQIRTWRPGVVLVPAAHDGDGLSQIVQQTVVAAVKLASDPAYLADQFAAVGCDPWSVQRLYLVSNAAGFGKVALDSNGWSSQLGEAWADAALSARALLDVDDRSAPGVISVQLVGGESTPETRESGSAEALNHYSSPSNRDGKVARHVRLGSLNHQIDIMDGLASTDGTARRPRTEAEIAFAGPLDGLAQQRQVQAIFEHVERAPETVFAHLAKGDELPLGIDASAAATLTFRIAQRLRDRGRGDLADKTLALLVDRYPADPLARWAQICRFQALAASENRVAELDERKGDPSNVAKPQLSRCEQALALGRQIEANWPDLFASPAVRYPLAAVYRQLGQDAKALGLYALDQRGVDRDAWWNCARGEMWLLDRKGPSPKPMVSCVTASERPHLDGRLDEALWKKCPPIVLSSPASDDRAWPATVMLAHDEQYLYIAIQCRQADYARYEATPQRRTRDADLSQRDRVDIFLDLDRSYATYYHFTVDHRGWAADAFGNDRSWDPKWFVAAETTAGTWTAEAAIPLAELKANIVPGKTIWALGLQRTVPGVGFQSWTTPASTTVAPEGFGWVEFE
jgi:photosystem II stability/assembly factor-like uncharacterized protein